MKRYKWLAFVLTLTLLPAFAGSSHADGEALHSPFSIPYSPLVIDVPPIAADALPELPRIKVDTQLKLDAKYLKDQLAKPVARRDRRFKYITPGSDLNVALKEANRGDILVLEAGVTYSGTNGTAPVLPKKDGEDFIYIISSAYAELPDEHKRITPQYADKMPKIINTARPDMRSLGAAAGAGYYRFMGIEFTNPEESKGSFHIIGLIAEGVQPTDLIDNYETLAIRNIIFDRCYIHGSNDTGNFFRGIQLHGTKYIGVVDCWIERIQNFENDSQCVAGQNYLGLKVENCYLEATGENIMLSGMGGVIAELTVGDVELLRNHFFKPDRWNRFVEGHKVWRCKNLFELKAGQRIFVDGNIFENNWKESDQWGYGILFTNRTDNGKVPHSTIRDITFTNNIIKNSSGGFQIAGLDDGKYGVPSTNILIRNNLILINDYSTNFATIPYNSGPPSGDPADKKEPFQLVNQVANLIIDHNTVITGGSYKVSIMMLGRLGDESFRGFRYTNNVSTSPAVNKYGSKYGIVTEIGLEGSAGVNSYARDAVIAGNVFAGIPDRSRLYPQGNYFPEKDEDVMFNDYANKDYRLALDSDYGDTSLTTDGKAPGADLTLIYEKTRGVAFYGDETLPPLRIPEPLQYFEPPATMSFTIGELIPLTPDMLKADVSSAAGESSAGHPLANLLKTEPGQNPYVHEGIVNITVDLGEVKDIGSAALCNNNIGQLLRFNVALSEDGATWRRAARDFPAGKSPDDIAAMTDLTIQFGFGKSESGYWKDTFILYEDKIRENLFHSRAPNDSPTYIVFAKPQKARYVKFTVYGNTNRNQFFQRFSNISYIQVFGPSR